MILWIHSFDVDGSGNDDDHNGENGDNGNDNQSYVDTDAHDNMLPNFSNGKSLYVSRLENNIFRRTL